MRIGIPKEIKVLEGRVALIPAAVAEVVRQGHEVHVQAEAGEASGYSDEDYLAAGATIEPDAASVYGAAKLVLKVKEPIEPEYALLREDHIVFSYLHLAATPVLARALQDKGLTAVAFETVEEGGGLPLLAPMSDIAGRLAVQAGSNLLFRPNGGRGLMLGGMPAAERGHVVILGAGTVGSNAAAVAASLGARLTVFDRKREKLARMHSLGANVTGLPAFADLIAQAVEDADLLVGAVLLPGGRAPVLVSEEQVEGMRPGSVIVDVAVDQGGCIATTRPTDWEQPTYEDHGAVHFAVTNMPGAVPRTASQALSASLVPFLLRLAGPEGLEDPAIHSGINVQGGKIVHAAVAEALK
jgi:alanine dehydrogenase